MFTSSLHNIKSKFLKIIIINKLNFGKGWKEFALLMILLVSGVSMIGARWSEGWKLWLSGGQAWLVGQRLVAGQPPSPSFLSFSSTIYLFGSTTTPLGQSRGAMATWAGRPTAILGQLTTSWLPYNRVAKGSLLLHATRSQETPNFLNPSPSF
jgi:hypothetical protein